MNTLRLQLHLRLTNPTNQTKLISQITQSNVVNSKNKPHINMPLVQELKKSLNSKSLSKKVEILPAKTSNQHSRIVFLGAASLGVAFLLMGFDDHNRALALGPEGPLMEEFWDNLRRYALYALTVSTGAISVLLEPIIELLKNPISAVLIIVILGGGFFIISQVVSAMVGLSDFSYEYSY